MRSSIKKGPLNKQHHKSVGFWVFEHESAKRFRWVRIGVHFAVLVIFVAFL